MPEAVLTEEQRKSFDLNGYLVVEDALSPDMIKRLTDAVDRLDARLRREQGKGPQEKVEKRNILAEDFDAFRPLITWPKTAPLAWQLLGPNIHIITSHMIVLPPAVPETDPSKLVTGFHRDGGTSPTDLAEPHPRMFLKIAYFLTDLTQPGSGQFQVVPGSNRILGPLPKLNGSPHPHGAIELRVRPGTAVLFENRTYHGVAPNFSRLTRKSLYFGYGYRWLRPMDYQTYPREILQCCTPLERQMLGDASYDLGYYLPKEEDVPLRKLMGAAVTVSPYK